MTALRKAFEQAIAERTAEENHPLFLDDYVERVKANPTVAATAHERIYNMITSEGSKPGGHPDETSFDFFSEELFGLDFPLERLVRYFDSAAMGQETRRRILLMWGPPGGAKSSIAAIIKLGLEMYSLTDAGAVYAIEGCPMHEEPLHLVPPQLRGKVSEETGRPVEGKLCPVCSWRLREEFDGDFLSMPLKRIYFSEAERIGIGTFEPADPKTQSMEQLTGGIDYVKIAKYGSEGHPMALDWAGEFSKSNRGVFEAVEFLKLEKEFRNGFLTAAQEKQFKPPKFGYIDLDTVILAHSVAGDTPIAYRHNGIVRWTNLAGLHSQFPTKPDLGGAGKKAELEVMAHNFETGQTQWTPVVEVTKHPWKGRMLTTSQKWGVVETTPNHAIYDRDGAEFYPDDKHEVMAARSLPAFGEIDQINIFEGMEDVWLGDADYSGLANMTRYNHIGFTRPAPAGYMRLTKPRAASAIKAIYDVQKDSQDLKDLITVLVWYATEGHINGDTGIVISQNDPDQLARVRDAHDRIMTRFPNAEIRAVDDGAKTDSAYRLYLSSDLIGRVCAHYCGRLSVNKRLPDFLFQLPAEFIQHAFDELMITDGSRKIDLEEGLYSDVYRDSYFNYKTLSSLLAAQVGTLASLLGNDYSVYRYERDEDRVPTYQVRYVNPKRRRISCEKRLIEREVVSEEVYDIECLGLHNFVCGVGGVVCHNTNEAEYRRFMADETNEALRDRMFIVEVPYNTRLHDEELIYNKLLTRQKTRPFHIAPHTLNAAGMVAVLSRLQEFEGLELMEKMKLYDGEETGEWKLVQIPELKRASEHEGMKGIGPRAVINALASAAVKQARKKGGSEIGPYLTPITALMAMMDHVEHLDVSRDEKERLKKFVIDSRTETDRVLKDEVRKAFVPAFKSQAEAILDNYLTNVRSYLQDTTVRDPITQEDREPDEKLMRAIEEKVSPSVPETAKDTFRQGVFVRIGMVYMENGQNKGGVKKKTLSYNTDLQLGRAIEEHLFEEMRDVIRITVSKTNPDPEQVKRLNAVIRVLVEDRGYSNESAQEITEYVAQLLNR